MLTPISGPTAAVPPVRKTAPEAEQGPQDTFEPGPPAWGQSMTGDIRFHAVHSDTLHNDRAVWVYLPPGYHDHPEKHYPVLYACDGQNVFERGTAFGGVEWGVDESAQRLIDNGQMKDTIIVAVSNAGAQRIDEYTPVPDPKHGGGHAEDFSKFMIDELKPMIDTRYRTLKTAENTGIMGSSLGGLVSLYVGFNHPAVYGLVGALSPSLWWAGKDMISSIAHLPPRQGPQKLWLDMGTAEDSEDANHNGVPDTLDNTRELRDVLKARGFEEGKTLFYHEIPGASHNEDSWSKRVDQVMASLYPPG